MFVSLFFNVLMFVQFPRCFFLCFSNVFVSITQDKNNLKLIVKDNGTKITKEYRTLNGNGIKNMKLRAEKINGKIHFSYNKGFTVELLFNYLSK